MYAKELFTKIKANIFYTENKLEQIHDASKKTEDTLLWVEVGFTL